MYSTSTLFPTAATSSDPAITATTSSTSSAQRFLKPETFGELHHNRNRLAASENKAAKVLGEALRTVHDQLVKECITSKQHKEICTDIREAAEMILGAVDIRNKVLATFGLYGKTDLKLDPDEYCAITDDLDLQLDKTNGILATLDRSKQCATSRAARGRINLERLMTAEPLSSLAVDVEVPNDLYFFYTDDEIKRAAEQPDGQRILKTMAELTPTLRRNWGFYTEDIAQVAAQPDGDRVLKTMVEMTPMLMYELFSDRDIARVAAHGGIRSLTEMLEFSRTFQETWGFSLKEIVRAAAQPHGHQSLQGMNLLMPHLPKGSFSTTDMTKVAEQPDGHRSLNVMLNLIRILPENSFSVPDMIHAAAQPDGFRNLLEWIGRNVAEWIKQMPDSERLLSTISRNR